MTTMRVACHISLVCVCACLNKAMLSSELIEPNTVKKKQQQTKNTWFNSNIQQTLKTFEDSSIQLTCFNFCFCENWLSSTSQQRNKR